MSTGREREQAEIARRRAAVAQARIDANGAPPKWLTQDPRSTCMLKEIYEHMEKEKIAMEKEQPKPKPPQ